MNIEDLVRVETRGRKPKLSAADQAEIFRRWKRGERAELLAVEFEISASTAFRIIRDRSKK